jgi:probable rRNA maturation factor
VADWLKQVHAELKRRRVVKAKSPVRELTLVFLEKKPALKINQEFRGKAYATDVLSFDSMDPGSWGELILCPEVLKLQAKEHKLSYQHELGYMLLHGVLHLLGYDHETSEEDAREMFAIQDAIFAKLTGR